MCLHFASCKKPNSENLPFKKISTSYSNLDFNNTITENDLLNILDYEYLYNGGGVGIGDFNADGLPDVCFTGNMVSSRIYINQGNLKFKDVTEEAGFITDRWCNGISIVDINDDGKPDIHLATAHDLSLGEAENYFFINKTDGQGKVKFENLAQEMKLADNSYSMQAVWLDFDKDGDLDMFLANNSKEEYPKNNPFGQRKDGKGKSTDRLFRNNGPNENGIPTFEDISMEAGITIEGWSLGVTVVDINDDQLPDIYVANDFMSNDILYINNGDGTFANRITAYLKHQSHNSMGIDVADVNNDGAVDLLVLDMLPEDNPRKKTMFSKIPFDRFNTSIKAGYQPQFVRNVLQINNADGTFSDLGYAAGIAETDWSWSPLVADFDNDGLRDIYITNGYRKDITDMDFVDFNNSTSTFGPPDERRKKLIAQLETMEGVKKSNFYFKNLGSNKFLDTTAESGLQYPSYSNGAAYADLDLDGDLDLIVNNIDEEALLFENKASDSNNGTSNYLRIAFKTDAHDLGSKVWVFSKSGRQYAEFYPQKGYLSSFEPVLHFGLGDTKKADSVKILWPDQSTTVLTDVAAKQLIVPKKGNNKVPIGHTKKSRHTLLERVNTSNKIGYKHKENTFDDFKKWPLRFRGHSKPGPIIVSDDINGDSLEDVYIGGTKNQKGAFYLQNASGGFDKNPLGIAGFDSIPENSGALLFDADGDGDLDLYAANGSSENYGQPDLYQDRLYLNDGGGSFSHSPQNLPEITFPTNTIITIDYDRDGDLDLFVGGRLDPNQYPLSPRSYLLNNEQGIFTDVTAIKAPALQYPGMITGAIAHDMDNDGWEDLVLVGEWMPVRLFYNKQGTLQPDSSENGLQRSNGWWNCIKSADFDGDGDLDFIAGNWGLNNPFKASVKEPLTIYAKDYDDNGSIESILTQFVQHKEYIAHPRGTLMAQLPLIRRYTDSYHTYGSKTFMELFGSYDFDPTTIFKTYELASVYIENLGGGQFTYTALPNEAQWSPIFDLEVWDVNDDKKPDVLAVGNFSDTEVLTGHYDAGNGICLINKGSGVFTSVNSKASGFYVPQEARAIIKIKNNSKEEVLLIGLQKDSLKAFKRHKRHALDTLPPD